MTTSHFTDVPVGTSLDVSPEPWRPGAAQPALLRLGALLGGIGVLLQVPMDRLHPHHAAPNDSAAAFHEYAASQDWTIVHIGQWLGMLLIVFGLVSLAASVYMVYLLEIVKLANPIIRRREEQVRAEKRKSA